MAFPRVPTVAHDRLAVGEVAHKLLEKDLDVSGLRCAAGDHVSNTTNRKKHAVQPAVDAKHLSRCGRVHWRRDAALHPVLEPPARSPAEMEKTASAATTAAAAPVSKG